MQGKIDCYGLTDIGRKRDTNEDQFLIGELCKSMRIYDTSLSLDDQSRIYGSTQGRLLVVADGMGGHAAGERASTLAIDSFADYLLNTLRWLFRLDERDEEDFVDDLKSALEYAQSALSSEAEAIPERRGMGTTLTVAYIVWPRLYVVHAGDSRCYLFRGSTLWQITKDHTVAQEFVDEGSLQPKDVHGSRFGDMVWNVVGGPEDRLHAEAHKAELAIGDSLLLCTDGLTRHVSDEEIENELDQNRSAADVCKRLIDAANEAGGKDNITVVAVRFLEADDVTELAAEQSAAETPPAEEEAQPAGKRRQTAEASRQVKVGTSGFKFA